MSIAAGKGDFGLTPQGRIDGALNLRVAGLEQIAGLDLRPERRAARRPASSPGLNMLARSDIDGKRAVSVPLRFRDGRVSSARCRSGVSGRCFEQMPQA